MRLLIWMLKMVSDYTDELSILSEFTSNSFLCSSPAQETWFICILHRLCISDESLCWLRQIHPVVMYRHESWTIRKVEHWRIDVFELWCWRRLLRVPWTARSNQSILKEINSEYSVEGLMFKLQYFGYLMWRVNSLEKTLNAGMLGKIKGRRRRGGQRMRWLDGITDSMDEFG